MDIGKAFTFITNDERWIPKIGIGALTMVFSFLILPAFLLVGYSIAISRRVMQGDKQPLPEWDDWGKLLKDGLIMTLATLVYAIPMIVLIIGGFAVGGVFSSLAEGGDAAGAAIGGVVTLTLCASMIYGIFVALLTPAIYVQFIRKGTFGACFNFGEIMRITRSQIGNIVISILALIGAGLAASFAIGIVNLVPCLGQIVGLLAMLAFAPFMQMVTGHLYGQIAALVDGDNAPKMNEFDAI